MIEDIPRVLCLYICAGLSLLGIGASSIRRPLRDAGGWLVERGSRHYEQGLGHVKEECFVSLGVFEKLGLILMKAGCKYNFVNEDAYGKWLMKIRS